MNSLNVVIADDHPIVLIGVRELVARDRRFRVVGEALCSLGLIELLRQHRVDIVITDYNMPADSPYGDGLKLLDYLKRHFPAVQVLVLTMLSNPLVLTRLHELGVAGVIQKNQLHEEIQLALETLARRGRYRSRQAPPQSVLPLSADLAQRFASLSPKEFEVLRLFVAGLSVSDIARQQNRSSKTVSAQKVAAMRKLDASSDQDLLACCHALKVFD